MSKVTITVSITFRLSALSALANEEFSSLEEALVSITFRLSALSAHVGWSCGLHVAG